MFKTLTSLATIASLAFAAPSTLIQGRSSTIGQLYAYGTNISGLPVFYSDGLAYIGNVAPLNASVATNMTFSVKSSSEPRVWLATPTNTTILDGDWTDVVMYIDSVSEAFEPVGFTDETSALATSGEVTTSGFYLYGTTAMFISNSKLLSAWYAVPTDQDDLWVLGWNVDNVSANDTTPIVLKNV